MRAALPVELRAHADRISGRFHLDAPGWYAAGEEAPYLPEVAEAVWDNRVLDVVYRRWRAPTDVRRRLEPYGLVLKAGRWYVVAGPGPRTYRVDQILELTLVDEGFSRPEGFDLAAYWTAYQRDFHDRLHQGEAVVRLAPGVRLPRAVTHPTDRHPTDPDSTDPHSTDPDGWTVARVPIESIEHAQGEFLRLGTDVEVLEPPELRALMARTSAELAERYGNSTSSSGD